MSSSIHKLPIWSLKLAAKLSGRPTGISDEVQHRVSELGCIFIHIPKCAGNAVQKSLFGEVVFGHQTIRQYQIALPRSLFHKAWKFTVTRDPWERIVSAWRFLKAGGFHEHDAAFFTENLSKYQSFDKFVNEWLVFQDLNQCGCLHFKTQMHYIKDFDGNLSPDCIVKLSDLSAEYEKLKQRFGGSELIVDNEAKGALVDLKSFYTSKETTANISRIYAEDIELLDY